MILHFYNPIHLYCFEKSPFARAYISYKEKLTKDNNKIVFNYPSMTCANIYIINRSKKYLIHSRSHFTYWNIKFIMSFIISRDEWSELAQTIQGHQKTQNHVEQKILLLYIPN